MTSEKSAWLWRIVVVVCLSLLAFAAVRSAIATMLLSDDPEAAAKVWPGHPAAEIAAGLQQIGAASATLKRPPETALRRISAAATSAPLAAEPFLVVGTQALSQGQVTRAERLLREARRRDPRSVAARVLLADLYLRGGEMQRGLSEVAALTRLLPGSPAPVVQTIVSYARQPGAEQPVRDLLLERPDLKDAVLTSLASDPGEAGRVIRLAGSSRPQGAWAAVLIATLVRNGRYREARELWARSSGVHPDDGLLVNPTFTASIAPPPFNWSYLDSGGLAEVRGNGELHAIAFGRESGVIASQLLTLPPGRYRLGMTVGRMSGEPGALSWNISCAGERRSLLQLPLGASRTGKVAAELSVPSDCAAQHLELRTGVNEFGRPLELTVSGLSLRRVGS